MKKKRYLLAAAVFLCLCCGCTEDETKELQFYCQQTKEAESSLELTEVQKDTKRETLTEEIVVYVCGEVVCPGVYMLKKDARLYQAVDAAGGFTENAASDSVNLAETVTDGIRIYIPSKDDMLQQRDVSYGTQAGGMVNINTADKEQLMTLPGIGEGKAADIIEYRNSCGGFGSIEDIKNVPGIKEAVFSKIRDKIVVS